MYRKTITILILFTWMAITLAQIVTPASVDTTLNLLESSNVGKTVTTPAIPPEIEICLLQDETGSYGDDLNTLKTGTPTVAENIFNSVKAISPGARFAVAGFRDYTDSFVERLRSGMNPNLANWLAGINSLSAPPGAGQDTPEAQFDAIVLAITGNDQQRCGFNPSPTVTKVLIVATDAPFHLPGDTPPSPSPYLNNLASTTTVLNNNGIKLIGLKAPGAGTELDTLAANTGGSTQPLSSNSNNIAAAILAGLSNLPLTITPVAVGCTGLSVTFSPSSQNIISGENAIFSETILVTDPSVAGTTVECHVNFVDQNGNIIGTQQLKINVPLTLSASPLDATNELGVSNSHSVIATLLSGSVPVPNTQVSFSIASGPNAGKTFSGNTDANGQITFTYSTTIIVGGTDTIDVCSKGNCVHVTKKWQDTTPPSANCIQGPNPDGVIPPAGGNNGNPHQNPDGFWRATGDDSVDPHVSIKIIDLGTGTEFGPFSSGVTFKYTQAPGGQPSIRAGEGAVNWNIKGKGDAKVVVTDASGNSAFAICLVPPSPS